MLFAAAVLDRGRNARRPLLLLVHCGGGRSALERRRSIDSYPYGAFMADIVAIASDHAAIEMKAALAAWLTEHGYEVIDLGPATAQSVDYPDYGYRLAHAIASGAARWGVALSGFSLGLSIAPNRNPAVRCALVSASLSDRLARWPHHSNAVTKETRGAS